MSVAALNFTLDHVDETFRHSTHFFSLPVMFWKIAILLGAGFMASRIRRVASSISKIASEITNISSRTVDQCDNCTRNSCPLFDVDGQLSDYLLKIRDANLILIKKATENALLVRKLRTKHKGLLAATDEVVAVAGKLAHVVNKLYWDIGEHDASFTSQQHDPSFVSDTPDGVDRILDSIVAVS